jgi:hypothetical protein
VPKCCEDVEEGRHFFTSSGLRVSACTLIRLAMCDKGLTALRQKIDLTRAFTHPLVRHFVALILRLRNVRKVGGAHREG